MSQYMGAIVTIGIFMIVHLCYFIWWASRIETTLCLLVKQVDELAKSHAGYMTIAEHSKDIARIDKDITNIWKRLDAPHACPNGNHHKG